jgi:peptide/nickel transport system ATP-binding protein
VSSRSPLLIAEELARVYRRRGRAGGTSTVHAAVDGVSFAVDSGEAVGVVGESGSGKSTLTRLLLALEKPDRGTVRFDGVTISDLPEAVVRPLRRHVQAVFQDPSTSLDPCLTAGQIISEPLDAHLIGTRTERRERVADVLEQVGLPVDAARRYPSAFSGGERQRIAIARALAPAPRLLILDEPVSSLDVSIQAQILDLVSELHRRHELAMVLVSHDLGVVRRICERVCVMQRGKIVETGPTDRVLKNPDHPYTRELLDASHLPSRA